MTTLDTLEDNITSKRISSEDIWGPVRSHLVIVYALTVIYGFIFIFGFFGNIITCVVVIRNKYMHTVTNFYLLSLAVSDLLLLVSGLPMEMYQIWFRYPYIFGETFCILQGLAAETSANATVLTITAFTIERYIAICYPFISRNAMKLKRAVRYIILIWVVSFIFAIPQAIKRGLVYAKDEADNLIQELSICTVKNDLIPHTFGISMMLFFIIPMTIITILYILIGLKLRRPKVQNPDKRDQILILTTAGEITQQHEDHDDLSPYIIHNQSTKRVVKMLVAVVVTFFVCWAPFQVQRLVAVYGYAENDTSDGMLMLYEVVTYVSGILYYLSTVINPILYNIMSNKFRLAFQDTLKLCPCNHRNSRRNSGEIGHSSLPRFNFELKNYNSLVSGSGSNRAIYNSYFEKITDLHQRPLVISFRKQPNNRSQFEINKINRTEEFSLQKCSHSYSLPGISMRKNNFNEFPSTVKIYTFDSRNHYKHPCTVSKDHNISIFYSE